MQLEKTCQEHCQIQCILYTVYLYANNNAAIHHSCLLVDLHTELQLCITKWAVDEGICIYDTILANQLSHKWTETELNWAIWNSFIASCLRLFHRWVLCLFTVYLISWNMISYYKYSVVSTRNLNFKSNWYWYWYSSIQTYCQKIWAEKNQNGIASWNFSKS